MTQLNEVTGVSGGKIWHPKAPVRLTAVKAQAMRDKWEKEELALTKRTLISTFIGAALIFLVLIYNIISIEFTHPTEEYFSSTKIPLLQAGASDFWINVVLLSIGSVMLLITSIITFREYLTIYLEVLLVVSLTVIILISSLFGFSTYSSSATPAKWLQNTHGLFFVSGEVPLVDGEISNTVIVTNEDNVEVQLTLENKDNKIYITEQEESVEK